MEYMIHWKWLNEEIVDISQFPSGTIGFVYVIKNQLDDRAYIGKKYLYRGVKWQTYWGSCRPLTEDIKRLGKERFTRRILKPTDTNIRLTYYEVKYQMLWEVLERDSYNSNILGKIYKGKI